MNLFREIKWFIQRGKRGWADCDAWGVSDYLNDILPQLLRRLKGQTGCPSEFYDAEATNNECHRWDEALETMAQGFEAAKWLDKFGYHRWVDGPHGKKLEIDEQATANAQKKAEKGLQLFAKYYQGLWD